MEKSTLTRFTRKILRVLQMTALFAPIFVSMNCSKTDAPVAVPPVVDPLTVAPSASVISGAAAWDDWNKTEAGGSGTLVAGATNKDFVRCKSCHGWDALGTKGGYVGRVSTATRPSPNRVITGEAPNGIALANLLYVNGVIATGKTFTTAQVTHAGTGRTFIEANYAATTAGTPGTLEGMPDYAGAGGLTAAQVTNVIAFLAEGHKIQNVATLTVTPDAGSANLGKVTGLAFNGASVADGAALYTSKCVACHNADGKAILLDGGSASGIGKYLGSNTNYTKYTEAFHKIMYGVLGTTMTPAALGNLTAAQVRDILAYIQANDGTVFTD